MKSWLKRIIKYLTREELDIGTQISNIVLLLSSVCILPCIIISIAIHTSLDGIIAEIILMLILPFLFWYINSRRRAQFPIAMAMVGLNVLVFPLLYFECGGRTTGVIFWMLLGSLFAALLLKGWYRIATYVVNIVVFGACLYVQHKNLATVDYLTAVDEVHDLFIAYSLVLVIISSAYKIQASIYNKQKSLIEAKEAELKRVNEELKQAVKSKLDFVSTISHEVRTPISTVLGMNEMIIRDALDPHILNYAKDIDVAGKQLISVIDDILDITKVEAGTIEIVPTEYSVIDLVSECAKADCQRARDKKLDFQIEVDSDTPKTLRGDVKRIKQIILNITGNAIKHTSQGYVKLSIGYEDEPDGNILLKITVKDTGRGVSVDKLPFVFNDYVRIGDNNKIEGSGLGLAISKRLTELMGGSIECDSTYGTGTTFSLAIKQEVVDRDPCGEFSLDDKKGSSEKKAYRQSFTAEDANVLVVDDVLVNLNVARLLLRDTKMKIDLAESGEEALEYMRRKHYDVVLMDHIMPDMDGVETLNRIRELDAYDNKEVPVIALTANIMEDADRYYKDAGFCDYLSKPIKVNELEKSLITYLPEELVNITKR